MIFIDLLFYPIHYSNLRIYDFIFMCVFWKKHTEEWKDFWICMLHSSSLENCFIQVAIRSACYFAGFLLLLLLLMFVAIFICYVDILFCCYLNDIDFCSHLVFC